MGWGEKLKVLNQIKKLRPWRNFVISIPFPLVSQGFLPKQTNKDDNKTTCTAGLIFLPVPRQKSLATMEKKEVKWQDSEPFLICFSTFSLSPEISSNLHHNNNENWEVQRIYIYIYINIDGPFPLAGQN